MNFRTKRAEKRQRKRKNADSISAIIPACYWHCSNAETDKADPGDENNQSWTKGFDVPKDGDFPKRDIRQS